VLQISEAIASLAQRRDPLAGSLRVGLLPTIGPYLLPLVALKLRRAHRRHRRGVRPAGYSRARQVGRQLEPWRA